MRLANNPNVNVAGIITRIDTAQKYIFATGVLVFGIILCALRNNALKRVWPNLVFDVVRRIG